MQASEGDLGNVLVSQRIADYRLTLGTKPKQQCLNQDGGFCMHRGKRGLAPIHKRKPKGFGRNTSGQLVEGLLGLRSTTWVYPDRS
jgi:hypothetical protein